VKRGLALIIGVVCIASGLFAQTEQYNIECKKSEDPARLPCLLIAPGSGYHKDLPIITDLAKQANEAGFVTLRFNWSSRGKDMADSTYSKVRFEDVKRMIEIARKTPNADTCNVFIAGKSLGSIYAYNAAIERNDVRGIVLLTPIFPDDSLIDQIYPGLDSLNCPLMMVAGDNDADNAVLPVLYRAAAKVKSPANVVIVAGDHGLNVGDYLTESGQKRNMENISLANQCIVRWMQRNLK